MTLPRAVLLVPVAVALVVMAVAPRRGDDDGRQRERAATVVRVIDGDTIEVDVDGGLERLRYIGIDTPESVGRASPAQCYATAARRFNSRLVMRQRVRLVSDLERRDRYGRLLAYVYRDRDGLFVNAELLRRGYAQTLTIAPNVRHASRFAALARRARLAGDGLWSACRR